MEKVGYKFRYKVDSIILDPSSRILNIMTTFSHSRDITSLIEVGGVPKGIANPNLRFCRKLESLPENLPNSIKTIDLTGCGGLTSLPENLPNSITTLYLTDCRI